MGHGIAPQRLRFLDFLITVASVPKTSQARVDETPVILQISLINKRFMREYLISAWRCILRAHMANVNATKRRLAVINRKRRVMW
jgi:hypothetical protein